MQNASESASQVGPLAELFSENMTNAGQDVVDRRQFVGGVDEGSGAGGEVRRVGVVVEDFEGERFESALAGQGGERLFFGFERQIEIFQVFGSPSCPNLVREFVG